MAVRSVSDVIYVIIARLPLLAIAAGAVWMVMQGLVSLEMYSFGTEFFVGNDMTANQLPGAGAVRDEEILSDALASGDVEQMIAALDRVERAHAARAAAVVGG
jgi:hypothetical protein